jgi:methylenetetrahydrofolate dehydrogenase (NADP+)/methenyltetrahydrofolate cyclohydrolase
METRLLRGQPVRDAVVAGLAEQVRRAPRPPGLAVLLVGDDPASAVYVGRKEQACAELGYRHETWRYPADVAEGEVLERIAALNADPVIDGILVQMPLPQQVRPARVIAALDPRKDVDGFHPDNLGRLTAGHPRFVPCTPKGVLRLLSAYEIPVTGRRIAVVGRSLLVGRPLSILLSLKGDGGDATVTLCHSATPDLAAVTREAEIVVAAMGAPRSLGRNHIHPGAVVVDVGTTRLEAADGRARLVGDVDADALTGVAAALTPVPGGVGPMTIAMLMENTWEAMAMREAGA